MAHHPFIAVLGASCREDGIFFPGMCFASVSSLVPVGVP